MWQQSRRLEAVNIVTAHKDDPQTELPSLILILLTNVYLNVIFPSALSFSTLPVDIPNHSSLTTV